MEFVAAPTPVPLTYRLQDAIRTCSSDFDSWVGAAAAAFETKLPVPPSCRLFRSDGYFRLRDHHRSICYAPHNERPVSNVICVKGMEPFAPDFAASLERMANHSRDGRLSNLEHLIEVEDKLPGCVLYGEAIAEASIAATVHRRLMRDDAPLARLPLPIMCGRLPDAVAESAVREISARAPRHLSARVEKLAADGLGVYVYWYPSVPLRAWGCRAQGDAAALMSDRWIDLAGRLLRAGFLPLTARSFGRGQCCNPQNAVVDGGFADLDSIVPVDQVRDQHEVSVAIDATIEQIAASILHVTGKADASTTPSNDDRSAVRHMVRQRLARACDGGADPRLLAAFRAAAAPVP